MTTGTKTTDLTVSTAITDTVYPSGNTTVMGYWPVGFKWVKSWSGDDYPHAAVLNVFQKHWVLSERAVTDAMGGMTGEKRRTYLEKWLYRKEHPNRVTRAEHNYTYSIDLYVDRLYKFSIRDFYPPKAVIQTSTRTFRSTHGGGYTVMPVSRWNSNDTIALQGKLREKILGSDFDLGVFLGEGNQTLKLITSSATTIYKSLRALKKGDVREAVKAFRVYEPKALRKSGSLTEAERRKADQMLQLKEMSARWLELQYGWLPLLGDTYGAAEALAKQLNEPAVQTYRVTKRKLHDPSSDAFVQINSTIRQARAFNYFGYDRGQLIARVKEVNLPSLVGLTDPSSVLWELTPWSFVVDWFIPIGNYLDARGVAQSVTGTFVTTISTKELFTCDGIMQNPNAFYPDPSMLPEYRSRKMTGTRTVSSTLFTPRPQFKTLEKIASWQHCTNAIALLLTLSPSSAQGKPWMQKFGQQPGLRVRESPRALVGTVRP